MSGEHDDFQDKVRSERAEQFAKCLPFLMTRFPESVRKVEFILHYDDGDVFDVSVGIERMDLAKPDIVGHSRLRQWLQRLVEKVS